MCWRLLYKFEVKIRVLRAKNDSLSQIRTWCGFVFANLLSSQGSLVQAKAERSLSASIALAFLNCSQAKSHSLAPPAAIALQYTVERRLGFILWDRATYSGHCRTKIWNIARRLTCCCLGYPSIVGTSFWPDLCILCSLFYMLGWWHSLDCTWIWGEKSYSYYN